MDDITKITFALSLLKILAAKAPTNETKLWIAKEYVELYDENKSLLDEYELELIEEMIMGKTTPLKKGNIEE